MDFIIGAAAGIAFAIFFPEPFMAVKTAVIAFIKSKMTQ